MNQAAKPKLKKPLSYWVWAAAFVVSIIMLTVLIYVATIKVDYIWRWFRVPSRIVYEEIIEINAEIGGEVESISIEGKKATIRITGAEGTESYDVPAEHIGVEKGDQIFSGDVLAGYPKKKPGLLLQGLWITFQVSMLASIFGIILGLLSGLARISSNPALRWTASVYVEAIRGSPLLVQILIWYFVLGKLIDDIIVRLGGRPVPPLWWGVIALAVFAGAYVTEIVRAGIQSIHRGQSEAARSLGMTYTQSMIHIILPQALRRILPPLAGQFISLIKDSSLLGIIAIRELTKAAREAVSTSLQPFEFYVILGALYLTITFPLSMFVKYLERRAKLT